MSNRSNAERYRIGDLSQSEARYLMTSKLAHILIGMYGIDQDRLIFTNVEVIYKGKSKGNWRIQIDRVWPDETDTESQEMHL